MRLTSWGEAAAFLLARVLTYGFMFFAYPVLMAAVYQQLIRSGGTDLIMVVSQGMSALVWLVTLLLFLAFRGGFGAVPAIVAPPNRRNEFTSSGGEIGAYVLSVVVVMAALTGLNSWVLRGVYTSLRTSGHADAIQAVGLAVSAAAAIVFFLLFIALRAMLAAPASSQPSP
jgi:hypothetical protein